MNLNSENLTTRLNSNQEMVVEPSFIGFLRNEGYTLDGIEELYSVPSESEKGKSHLVGKVQTYKLPKDHPDLDIIEDQCSIWVCDCWSYRQSSELNPPRGNCKHVRSISKTEKAKEDENQETLI
jgi:hypothetical protein